MATNQTNDYLVNKLLDLGAKYANWYRVYDPDLIVFQVKAPQELQDKIERTVGWNFPGEDYLIKYL